MPFGAASERDPSGQEVAEHRHDRGHEGRSHQHRRDLDHPEAREPADARAKPHHARAAEVRAADQDGVAGRSHFRGDPREVCAAARGTRTTVQATTINPSAKLRCIKVLLFRPGGAAMLDDTCNGRAV